MPEVLTRSRPFEPQIAVPATLAEALDPAWLTQALSGTSGGSRVIAVEETEVIRTVATKVRFAAAFENGQRGHFCLKGLLDADAATARGGPTCVLEADFYGKVAPIVDMRVPDAVSTVIDRKAQQAVTVMRDLIAEGAVFCSALDPFTAEDALMSLDQLSRLHARSAFLDDAGWIRPRAAQLAKMTYVTPDMLQELLDGPRGEGLSPKVRSARNLASAIGALAERDGGRPQFMIHGDAHAGNIYRTGGGMGVIDWQLLQRGGWALDVAYHLNAVLPVDAAEAGERRLLDEYLAMMRGHGIAMPGAEQAWAQYREAVVYGYYLWSITRRVDPPVIVQFTRRLGQAVMRHDSFGLLGIS
ncbi:phosphotransferase [Novosphingobium beihaiensis]|uniref:Aminoglycoside phosphotransferase family protein n=1 Tax=Novosphingobium beihaiensis TaxID=2930389 RepID=A0ABT0BS06_9SPHN|nr:phosphotransferase [Novosphingobium beihaiensis]MCJ2187839.1 aminoglycoside phosphotransferase family protein [Novosphingobium beihaiensis]